MTNIRAVSLCSQAMIVTPQYVRDASGSVLFPDRLLHKLHGRGLAKSTICWISLFLSLSLPLSPSSSHLFSLSSVCFFSVITNTDLKTQPFSDCLQNKSFCWLEQRAQLRRVVTFFLFLSFFFFFSAEHLLPEIFRDTAVFSQRTCFSCH